MKGYNFALHEFTGHWSEVYGQPRQLLAMRFGLPQPVGRGADVLFGGVQLLDKRTSRPINGNKRQQMDFNFTRPPSDDEHVVPKNRYRFDESIRIPLAFDIPKPALQVLRRDFYNVAHRTCRPDDFAD